MKNKPVMTRGTSDDYAEHMVFGGIPKLQELREANE